MLNWLARKIGARALKNALIRLDTDARYLLIVDLPDNEIESLKKNMANLSGQVDMVVLGVPRFYLFQFGGKRDEP